MSKMTKKLISLGLAIALIGGLAAVYFGIEARNEREAIAAAEAAAADDTPSFHVLRLVEQSEGEMIRATFEGDGYAFTIEADLDEDNRVTWLYADDHNVLLEQGDTRNMMRDVFVLTAADMLMEAVDNPAEFGIGRVVATGYFRDGSRVVIRVGAMTPDHGQFYAMIDGDPALYLLNALTGNRLSQRLEDLVDNMRPNVDANTLIHLYIRERDNAAMVFGWDGTDEELAETVAQFGGAWITMEEPFPGRNFNTTIFEMRVLEPFQEFAPGEMVEMFPEDLARFGLDDPLLEFAMLDVMGGGFHLLFGNYHDDEHIYVMYADRPHVWLTESRFISGFLGLNPFSLIDRFVLLQNIIEVDRITIQSAARGSHEIVINNFQDEDERDLIDPVVDGQNVQEAAFRRFYQSLIAIGYEQEIDEIEEPGSPVITVVYYLLEAEPVTIEFFSFDSNFYAVRRYPNPVQFVASQLSVDAMFETLELLMAGALDR
ncbi:MAG: DUF4340 domain-containing protein [Defluviitaleaceae bacterium]|nr:DUF4340 domain-containing protein [Defluviitaleaceae bacterium]